MLEYATGLIRVLDKRILDQTDFERMAGAETAQDTFKILHDTDYADNLLDLKPEEFEKALTRDNKDLRKLFKKIIESKLLLKFLFLNQKYLKRKLRLKKLKKLTPRKIDETCDLKLYKERKKIAKKLRDKFLQEICKPDLDLNFDLDYIKTQAREYAYGTPIILEYYYKKLDAARKIRLIMNMKLNNIKHETGDFGK